MCADDEPPPLNGKGKLKVIKISLQNYDIRKEDFSV